MSTTDAKGWKSLEVAGKLCDVFEPSQAGPYVLLHLHGVGMETLAGNSAWTELLQCRGLRAVCPHGKRSWWTNRVCAEFDEKLTAERHLIQNVLPFIGERWGADAPKIGLTGISMGGQGALRLAMKHPSKFPVVASIAAAIDFQQLHGQGTTIDEMYTDKEAARQDTAPLHVHPLNWPRHILFVIDAADRQWLDGNQRLHEKLIALGIAHQVEFATSAGGHCWQYFNTMAPRVIDFVCRGLEAESLRIPMGNWASE